MKVLVDYMNVLFMTYHIAKRQLREETGKEELLKEDMGFFYHIFLNKINYLIMNYGPLILCHEGKHSTKWRRDIYNGYKANRDERKEQEEYKVLLETFPILEELLNNYPVKQIKVDGMEADDVIYAIATYECKTNPDEEIEIISTDKDLIQIKNHCSNVEIFNPIRSVHYESNENIVYEKAICGDSSDNIPGLHRVGIKTFEKMLNDKELWNKKMANGNKEIFETFVKIVDLSKFPKEKHEEAIALYKATDYNKFEPNNIEYFLYENKLEDLLMKWGGIQNDIITELINENRKDLIGNVIAENEDTVDHVDLEPEKIETEVDDILNEFI